MYRTHHCGALRIDDVNKKVTLSGWVQRVRKLGGMTFIDLRDRYGITQLVFDMETNAALAEQANKLGREFVVRVEGTVVERTSKNPDLPTGDIEIIIEKLDIIKASEVPPFTIEDESDGGEELRMKYRYLDIRRNPVKDALILRHKVAKAVRNYLDDNDFVEAETPYLIKSTPEGARDFVVPSRLSPGEFYALPQSPQVFKQLFMVGGLDRYYQIVKCFRDEDFRADRQPEFTQIDCEMSFVTQDEVIKMFSGMAKYIFKTVKGIEFEGDFPVMTYEEAMNSYGSDKPDLRFGMKIHQLNSVAQGKGFKVFDDAEYIGGICAEACANYSRKQLDKLIDFVKKPQIGAKGLVYVKYNEDGSFKSSVDKFYSQDDLKKWAEVFGAKPGDLILLISGEKNNSLNALNELRLEMGERLGLRDKNKFVALWVVDFPLLEWDEESKRFHAMHHPFTSPKEEDMHLLDTEAEKVRANAYDFVINGVEIGGGSIRIFDNKLQHKMFDLLGFTPEEAEAQFGFLMEAFKYGAPPHGGAAFGLDRWVALLNGSDSIRDVIAFPKNNAGRDIMMDAPAPVAKEQLEELSLSIRQNKE
ncbi:MAG: aspartate--tRNA ligase [Bacteroidales bacterium]|nr:aspartate--tRNA ligase [Bacteroidales bacterium]